MPSRPLSMIRMYGFVPIRYSDVSGPTVAIDDGVLREKQLLVDFLCDAGGGNLHYAGRDMRLTHIGMRISESDWAIAVGHLNDTLDAFSVGSPERDDLFALMSSTKADIVGV